MRPRFPVHACLALVTFSAFLAFFHERVDRTKGLDVGIVAPVFHFDIEQTPLLPIVPAAAELDSPLLQPARASALLRDEHGVLDAFYDSLWNLEKGADRQVHVLHYGDSPTSADMITGDARQLLQRRFGDGGHGFVLIAKPWAWYQHRDVDLTGSGWEVDTAVGTMREGAYGLGGVAFRGGKGAYSRIRLADHGHTQIEIAYLAQPGAGALEVTADGRDLGTMETAAPSTAIGFRQFDLPANTREIELRPTGAPLCLFGVCLRKSARGLIYDSIGLNGASTTVLSRAFSERHWQAELEHRQPDLVIINYGTNESGYRAYVEKSYEGELRRAIQRVRTALPHCSILVMSPMDRGERGAGNTVQTLSTIPLMVQIQERVARENGAGFFNTFEAMGGESTMARWYNRTPRLVAADLIHPSPQAARMIATSFVQQLLAGYNRFKMRQLQLQIAEAQAHDSRRSTAPASRLGARAAAGRAAGPTNNSGARSAPVAGSGTLQGK
jgi:lysophospholipase L1-like esterase